LEDQDEMKNWNAAEHFDTAQELMDRSYNRPHLKNLKEKPVLIGELKKDDLKTLEKKQKRKYEELVARKKRRVEINTMIEGMERSRNLRTQGKRKKIVTLDKFGEEDKSKTIYKWKNGT